MALERATSSGEEGQAVTAFAESVVEDAALAWLETTGWSVKIRSKTTGSPTTWAGRPDLPASSAKPAMRRLPVA